MSAQTAIDPLAGREDLYGAAVAIEIPTVDILCPICVETMQDPFVTNCGHSFCYTCIVTHLRNRKSCPSCSNFLTTEHIFPNFLLCKILRKAAAAQPKQSTSLADQVRRCLADSSALKIKDIDDALELLKEKRDDLSHQESAQNLQLLLLFLQHAREQKEMELKELHSQLKVLEQDLQTVRTRQPSACPAGSQPGNTSSGTQESAGVLAANVKVQVAQFVNPLQPQAGGQPRSSAEPSPLCPSGLSFGQVAPSPMIPFAPTMPGLYPGLPPLPPGGMFPPLLPGAVLGGHRSAFSPIGPCKLPGSSAPNVGHPASQGGASDPSGGARQPGSSTNSGPAAAGVADTAAGATLAKGKQIVGAPNNPTHQSSLPAANGVVASLADLATAKQGSGFQPYHQLHYQTMGQLGPNPAPMKPASPPSASMFSGCGSSATGNNKYPQPAFTCIASQGAGFSSTGAGNEKGSGQGTDTGGPQLVGLTTSASAGSGDCPGSGDMLAAARAAKKRKLLDQYSELEQCYLQLRSRRPSCQGESSEAGERPVVAVLPSLKEEPAQPEGAAIASASEGGKQVIAKAGQQEEHEGALHLFSGMLNAATHYSRLTTLAELPRPPGLRQGASCILSSIDFDADEQIFATAGVIQRIALYDFQNVLNAFGGQSKCEDPPLPVSEITTRSKLSSLSFNRFVKQHLLSSDYEGVVTLWDTVTRNAVHEYEAHEKRIWCVDFNPCETKLFASGSDDTRVKIWSTSDPSSITSLDIKANVCSVKWNPTQSHLLAIGSAGHTVQLYDIRKTSEALNVFPGHRKAVSYVRWLNSDEIVSASTDSSLRLWNLAEQACVRTYSGHTNEKNFVGLSCERDYIACGSETNEVYLYYKGIPKPTIVHNFSRDVSDSSAAPQHFISALCWRRSSGALLAANSQGNIWIMSLSQ